MIELADLIIKLTSSNSKLVFLPLPSDDPKQRKPDISLAFNKLDQWKPEVKLEDGFLETINYFKTALGIHNEKL